MTREFQNGEECVTAGTPCATPVRSTITLPVDPVLLDETTSPSPIDEPGIRAKNGWSGPPADFLSLSCNEPVLHSLQREGVAR